MIFSRFRLICIFRIILIIATIFILFYIYFNTTYYATLLIIGLILGYQIFSLIHFVEKTQRELKRFLSAIKHAEFSESFVTKGNSYEDSLREEFAAVMNDFRKIRSQKEEHFRYLQTVVQHVGIGLIVFKPDGEVELINSAAKRILQINQLKSIHSLKKLDPQLVRVFLDLKPGQKKIVKLDEKDDVLQLAIYATEFKMRDQKFTLVSIQNIHSELEEKEMEAWQNIIRVLTHEIMNSITPISSLASTVHDLIKNQNGSIVENVEDINLAIKTIKKRSKGLVRFIDSFRNISQIPQPKFKIILIDDFFKYLESFFNNQFDKNNIHQEFSVEPETLELTADQELIEQVLINLILNGIHAIKDQPGPKLSVQAGMDERGRIVIRVVDNGPGIIDEVLEKIFIPFFTTKKEGSGIGLSLSRQIMRMHKGSIHVKSKPDIETVVTLRF